jgi:hypothetical protein
MTPEENKMLGSLSAKIDDMHVDVKRIVPLVYKHEEAIKGLKSSNSWIKKILLTTLPALGLGGLAAKIWG